MAKGGPCMVKGACVAKGGGVMCGEEGHVC